MREILFRGKRKRTGAWLEGCLVMVDKRCFISKYPEIIPSSYCTGDFYSIVNVIEVIPETVGQYTGLNDKNGKKIFDGDVTKHQFIFTTEFYEIGFSGSSFYHREIGKQKTYCIPFDDPEFGMDGDSMEIIGNIHDNPELLEVK